MSYYNHKRLVLACLGITLLFAAFLSPGTGHATCANPLGTVIDLANAKTATAQGYYAKIRRAYDQGSSGGNIIVPDGYHPFDFNDDGDNDIVLGDPKGGIFDSSVYTLGGTSGGSGPKWADGDNNEGNLYILYGKIPAGSFVLEDDIGLTSSDPLPGTTIAGVNANDQMGSDLTVGDFNGDNCPDLLTGVSGYGDYGGAALFNGTASGLPYGPSCFKMANTTLAAATEILTNTGTDDDTMGSEVDVADLNKDGYDDFIIRNNIDPAMANAVDYIYVYFGGASGFPASSADYDVSFTLDSTGTNDTLYDVAAGDFNGDGCPDLAFGNYMYDSALVGAGAGAAFVVYNKTAGGGLCRAFQQTKGTQQDWDVIADMREGPTADLPGVGIYGEKADQGAGAQLAFADFDGDGVDDLMMGIKYENKTGSPSYHGGAFIVYGQTKMLMRTQELFYFNKTPPTGYAKPRATKFVSSFDGNRAGYLSVSTAGDLDNDGYEEFLFSGENQENTAGLAYIAWGGAKRLAGVTSDMSTSPRVTTIKGYYSTTFKSPWSTPTYGVGDVTGDGIDDFVLTTSIDDTPRGSDANVPDGWYATDDVPKGWAYSDDTTTPRNKEPDYSSLGDNTMTHYGEIYVIEGGCR